MTGPEETDILIARIAMADREAFEELYAAAAATLFGICQRILEDETEAEDILLDLFVSVWRAPETYRRGIVTADLQLCLAARGAAISQKRVRLRHPSELQTRELFETRSAPKKSLRFGHGEGALREALGQVQPARAVLLERVLLNGESYDDLAVASDVDAPTIRSSMQSTLRKLSEALDEADDWGAMEDIAAAERALGLIPHDGMTATSPIEAIWQSEIAQIVMQEVRPVTPPAQVLRRLRARVFAGPQDTLWTQLWPYAVGGAAAAIVLWLAANSNLLLALD